MVVERVLRAKVPRYDAISPSLGAWLLRVGIELQFRWLPYLPKSREKHPTRQIQLQEQKDTTKGMIYQFDTYSEAGANFNASNRPVCSGHIFQVYVSQKDENLVAMIKLQWALLQVAAMSGAVQAPELLRGPHRRRD